MDLNRLTRDADDLIRKVVSRYNQLYIPAGSISQLELDLMLEDMRKLYDTFKTIGQLNLTFQNETAVTEVKVNKQVPAEPPFQTAPIPAADEKSFQTREATATLYQPEPEPKKYIEPVPVAEPEIEPVETVSEQKIIPPDTTHVPKPAFESPAEVEAAIFGIEKPAQETVNNHIPSTGIEPTTATLAEKFNLSSRSISDTMASTGANGVIGSRLIYQPISDLSTGIGLNDKFSFISELFANNPVLYDEAITRINKAVNSDEAGWILQKYHSKEWEHKHETLARLKDFIKRRFI
jgi:hypothetical protein